MRTLRPGGAGLALGGAGPEADVAALDPAEVSLRHQVKRELRTRMRAVRRAVPAEARAARSARIAEHVRTLDAWAKAETILVFLSMRTEVDTSALIDAARATGARVAAPRVTESGLRLHALRAEDPRVLGAGMQVEEPPSDAPEIAPEEIDLVLVPALALDPRGARIGYGAGYYDDLLRRLSRAVRVGVAFDFQLVAEVPETPGDERVHVVVTDARVIDVEADRRASGAE